MSWKYRPFQYADPTVGTGYDLASGQNGVRPPAGVYHAGNSPAQIAADGVDTTPVVTEIYVSPIFVSFTVLATGIAVFNGSVVATDKYKVALFDRTGAMVRTSAAAGFQPTATDSYEQVAFALAGDGVTAATTLVVETGIYYAGIIFNGTTNRFNAFGIGAFPTIRVTGAVFSTAFNTTSLSLATLPSVFTATDKPPICSLY